MSPTDQAVFDAALSLPAPLRAQLAEALLASLPDRVHAETQRAWVEERRRAKDVDQGHVELVPGEEAMQRLSTRTNS